MLKPAGFAIATVKVPLAVKPLICRVYTGPEPLKVPLVTVWPEILWVRVIFSAARPVTAWLNVNVNCVVVKFEEPLAVTLLNVTAVGRVEK